MDRKLVLFDLDGTLVDTAPDLVDSLNHTIAKIGLSPVDHDDLVHFVGQGARAMIGRAAAHHGASLSDSQSEWLLGEFVAHYRAEMPGRSRPYPGALEAMDRLTAAGFALAVCTNKLEALARDLLDGLGLAERFVTIAGGDTFAVRKPHPGHIEHTVARAGARLDAAAMIGDSINDILAARRAGIASIAVRFGYSDRPVETLGAGRVIAGFEELDAAMVEALIAAR